MIRKFAGQGHFKKIAPDGILTDDLRGYFNPFISASSLDKTYGDHLANTITVYDITYAPRRAGEKISIEEFLSAIAGKEPAFRQGPAVEKDDDDLPPLVDLSPPPLLEDEVIIVVVGDDGDEELFDVPL